MFMVRMGCCTYPLAPIEITPEASAQFFACMNPFADARVRGPMLARCSRYEDKGVAGIRCEIAGWCAVSCLESVIESSHRGATCFTIKFLRAGRYARRAMTMSYLCPVTLMSNVLTCSHP